MADIIELLIRASTAYDGGLNKVSDALKSISNATGLSGSQLKALEAEFARLTAQGLNFKQVLGAIASSGNNFGAGVGAAAKQIQTQLNQAAQAAANLNAQIRTTNQGLVALQNAATNPLAALKNSAVSAAASLGPVGIGIGAVGVASLMAGEAVFKFGKELIDLIDEQGRAAQATVNMATQMGISAGAMQKLQVEGQLVGVSFQTMQMASRQLAMGLEGPTGAGKRAAQALRDLGIAAVDSNLHLKKEGDIYEQSVAALARIEDQTKRTEEATKLYGARGSASLQSVIANYKELDATARRLGYVDNTQMIESLAEGQRHIEAVTLAFKLMQGKLTEKLEPIIIRVSTKLEGTLEGLLSGKAQPELIRKLAAGVGGMDLIGTDAVEKSLLFAADKLEAALNKDASHAFNKLIPGAGAQRIPPQLQALTDADLAKGNAIIDKASANLAKTLDGMTADLSATRARIKEEENTIALAKQSGSTHSKAAQDAVNALTKDQSLEASQQANINAQREAARSAEEIARHFKQIEEDLKHPGRIAPESLTKAQALLGENRDKAGNNARYQQDAQDYYRAQIDKYFNELIAKAQGEGQKELEKAAKKVQTEMDRDFKSFNEALTKSFNADALRKIAFQDDIDKVNATHHKDALSLQQKSTLGFARLQQGDTQGIARQEFGYQSSAIAGDALGRVAETQALIDKLKVGADQSEEVQNKIKDLMVEQYSTAIKAEDEISKLRLDTELKVAELRKKELDSYKEEAGSIFDAIRQPGGRGMQMWFRNQGLDLAKGTFSNVTAPVLQGIGQSVAGTTAGAPSYIQGMFKGTILDSARAKSPQIDATDKNTLALIGLTDTLTGQHSAGAPSISPAPGSIAANAAAALGSPTVTADSLRAAQAYGDMMSPRTASAIQTPASVAPFMKLLGGSGAGAGGSMPAGLAQFLKGATGGIGNWDEIFHSDATDAAGNTYSGLNRLGAGIGTAAAAGTGIYESINQFSKGGSSGIAGGLGAAALTGGALAGGPSNPIGAVLDGFGLVMELFKSLLPDPVTLREAQIANQTQYNTYVPPPTLNRYLSASGGYEQVNNKYGMPSATSFSSVAIEAPYKYQSPIKDPSGLYQNWQTAPGQVIEPYQTPAAQPSWMTSQAPAGIQVHLTVNAMDSQSFLDAHDKIAGAVQKAVVEGHPVGNAMARAILGS